MTEFCDPQPHPTESFPTTRWSLVLGARDDSGAEAHAALAELCSTYWYPLYAFIRRKGHSPEDSQDLTQAYFARLLEKGVIASADRRKGRFRAFLRTDCQHFLMDQYRRKAARGGKTRPISIDARDAEGRYRFEPADDMGPDRLFDRAWAMTLLDRVLELLAAEYAARARSEVFDRLKVVLTGGKGAVPSATSGCSAWHDRKRRQCRRPQAPKTISSDSPGADRRDTRRPVGTGRRDSLALRRPSILILAEPA